MSNFEVIKEGMYWKVYDTSTNSCVKVLNNEFDAKAFIQFIGEDTNGSLPQYLTE